MKTNKHVPTVPKPEKKKVISRTQTFITRKQEQENTAVSCKQSTSTSQQLRLSQVMERRKVLVTWS